MKGGYIMIDKNICISLLKQREQEVSENDIYLKILQNAEVHIEMAKKSTLNPFKRNGNVKEKKEQIEKVRTYFALKFGIEKIGEGEQSEYCFLINVENHIKALNEDIGVLKNFIDKGIEFKELPSSKYDKGILKTF